MIRTLILLALIGSPVLAQDVPDEQTPRQAYPGAETCPVKLPVQAPGGVWTEQEHWTWEQVCTGQWADLRYADDISAGELPCRPTDVEAAGTSLPETRKLRPEFLQLILTREPWISAPVKPQVIVGCAQIDGLLDLASQQVRVEFALFESHFPDGADLTGARFDKNLILEGTVFGGNLVADHLQVGGSVKLGSGSEFDQASLIGAKIDGDFDAGGAYFAGLLQATDLVVARNLFLRGNAIFGDVTLLDAVIGGDLDATNSDFIGIFDGSDLRVGGNVYFNGGATFFSATLIDARIDTLLQLSGGRFEGVLNLTGAQVGELGLLGLVKESEGDGYTFADPSWGESASLILRNSKLRSLHARPASFRREDGNWIKAELTGLTYDRLGGSGAGDINTLIDAEAGELIDWIENTRPDEMADRHDPGPYEQLAHVLNAEGLVAKAKAVRFAEFRHRDAHPGEDVSWWSKWMFRPASRWLLGYGVYPFTLLWWFAGLVVLGIFVSGRTADPRLQRLDQRMWYSLENALPLVELNTGHKDVSHGSAWVETFFHAQKILGFLFATLLVGALSLLTG